MHNLDQQSDEQEYPHWQRVYVAVIITTIVVIAALWLFSKTFA